jgi:hypothetical protein
MTRSGFYENILFGFVEFQCSAVHAIPESGRFGAVIENVSQMTAAGPANYLRTSHTMGFVYDLFHIT